MIEKIVYTIFKCVFNVLLSLTLNVEVSFIDFSFVPLIVTPKGSTILRLLLESVEGVILYLCQA